MAIVRESTTRTRSGPTSWAASTAASHVPESFFDRWIDTTASAPASNAVRYAAAKAAGVGREVVTILR